MSSSLAKNSGRHIHAAFTIGLGRRDAAAFGALPPAAGLRMDTPARPRTDQGDPLPRVRHVGRSDRCFRTIPMFPPLVISRISSWGRRFPVRFSCFTKATSLAERIHSGLRPTSLPRPSRACPASTLTCATRETDDSGPLASSSGSQSCGMQRRLIRGRAGTRGLRPARARISLSIKVRAEQVGILR